MPTEENPLDDLKRRIKEKWSYNVKTDRFFHRTSGTEWRGTLVVDWAFNHEPIPMPDGTTLSPGEWLKWKATR